MRDVSRVAPAMMSFDSAPRGRAMSTFPMIPVDVALSTVLNEAARPDRSAEFQPLAELRGRVLAEDVTLEQPVPQCLTSIKDGFAVVASDGPGEYELVGTSRAGDRCSVRAVVRPGTVAYVTTGAPLPKGADAVVELERTAAGAEGHVVVNCTVRTGQDVRAIGSDAAAGEVLLRRGEVLGDAELGALAMAGRSGAMVWPRPVVAIASTGSELMDPTEERELQPGEVFDANRRVLLCAASDPMCGGARLLDRGSCQDEPNCLEELVRSVLDDDEVDVLVTSGGVSMGDRDLMKPLLARLGEIRFGRLLMKPGKPTTFATLPRSRPSSRQPLLVFALPGNPCSAFVTFHLLVAPALRSLGGWRRPEPRRVHCSLTAPLKLDALRPEYHRATVAWRGSELVATSTGLQRSSRLLSLLRADALLELPSGDASSRVELGPGTIVSALLLRDLRRAPELDAPFLAHTVQNPTAAHLPLLKPVAVTIIATEADGMDAARAVATCLQRDHAGGVAGAACTLAEKTAEIDDIVATIARDAEDGAVVVVLGGCSGEAQGLALVEHRVSAYVKRAVSVVGLSELMRAALWDNRLLNAPVATPSAVLLELWEGAKGDSLHVKRVLTLVVPSDAGSASVCVSAVLPFADETLRASG